MGCTCRLYSCEKQASKCWGVKRKQRRSPVWEIFLAVGSSSSWSSSGSSGQGISHVTCHVIGHVICIVGVGSR